MRVRAYSRWIDGDDGGGAVEDVDHVARLLARRDLLMLAASLRNFAEASRTVYQLRQQSVALLEPIIPPEPPFFRAARGDKSCVNLYSALSRILHSAVTEFNSDGTVSIGYLDEISLFDKYRLVNEIRKIKYRDRMVIFIISKNDGESIIFVDEMIYSIEKYIDNVTEKFEERSIYLNRTLRDG